MSRPRTKAFGQAENNFIKGSFQAEWGHFRNHLLKKTRPKGKDIPNALHCKVEKRPRMLASAAQVYIANTLVCTTQVYALRGHFCENVRRAVVETTWSGATNQESPYIRY